MINPLAKALLSTSPMGTDVCLICPEVIEQAMPRINAVRIRMFFMQTIYSIEMLLKNKSRGRTLGAFAKNQKQNSRNRILF